MIDRPLLRSKIRTIALWVIPLLAVVLGARKCLLLEQQHTHQRGQAVSAIARYQSLIRAQPAIEEHLKDLESRPQWTTQYVAKDRDAAVALLIADLSSLRQLMGLAATAGAPQPVETAPPGAVDVSLSFITTIDVLQRFLQAVEQQPHLLRVAALTVKAGPGASADGNARLTVQCVVRAHWRAPSEAL